MKPNKPLRPVSDMHKHEPANYEQPDTEMEAEIAAAQRCLEDTISCALGPDIVIGPNHAIDAMIAFADRQNRRTPATPTDAEELVRELEAALCAPTWPKALGHVHNAIALNRRTPMPDNMPVTREELVELEADNCARVAHRLLAKHAKLAPEQWLILADCREVVRIDFRDALAAVREALSEHPAGIAAQDGDRRCQCCGRANPVWFAPNELWNLAMGGPEAKGDPGGVLCPICFIERAEQAGITPTAWLLSPETPGAGIAAAAIDQNDAMRQELAHVGNLVSDLARALGVDQANDDGSWPSLSGRIEKLTAHVKAPSPEPPSDEWARAIEAAAKVAFCHSDDRPRRDSMDWNDGYIDGCRGASEAIRALQAPKRDEASE